MLYYCTQYCNSVRMTCSIKGLLILSYLNPSGGREFLGVDRTRPTQDLMKITSPRCESETRVWCFLAEPLILLSKKKQ